MGQPSAPPLFNRRNPTSIKGARASEAMIHAQCLECLKCLKKRSSRNYRSFRPLRSCAVGNAEDVRLRFYRQFRLCFTTTDFSGRKGIGLSPYPFVGRGFTPAAFFDSRRSLRREPICKQMRPRPTLRFHCNTNRQRKQYLCRNSFVADSRGRLSLQYNLLTSL